MSAKFEVHATNEDTTIKIATKYTLAGALSLADDLLEDWDYIYVREHFDAVGLDPDKSFKVVAKLSKHGLA